MFLNASEIPEDSHASLRLLRLAMPSPCLLEAAWGCPASLRLLKPLALSYSFRAPWLYSTCLHFPSHGLIRLVAAWWLLSVLHVLRFSNILNFVQFTYIYVDLLRITWCLLLSLETFWLCWGPLALSSLSNLMNPTQRTCVYEELLPWPDAYHCSLKPFDCAGGRLRFPRFLTLWIIFSVLAFMRNY